MSISKSSIAVWVQKTVPVFSLPLIILAGCAATGKVDVVQPGNVSEPRSARTVQAGDIADVRFICRLSSGEIAAAAGYDAPDNGPKSNIFFMRKETGALPVTAVSTEEPLNEKKEVPFEEDITDRLARLVTGMKEGETRRVNLTATDVPARNEQNYVLRVARIRTRPKELKMQVAEFKYRTGKAPEVGQSFVIDPAFPGTVESVTEQDVVIRFSAKPGDVIETPFGPGHIREEGPNYKVDINARKDDLNRLGGLVGRITDVDDQEITIDYRNPFGGETLTCDVTVEHVKDAKSNGNGE